MNTLTTTPEANLDWATFFETEIRPRQRRRARLKVLATIALVLSPALTMMVLGAG
ncbi:MAG: hypothetical protein U1C74_15815 [Phenylobacterium sp.]|nr:hypothetical protein [Phenylobacterium sp.]